MLKLLVLIHFTASIWECVAVTHDEERDANLTFNVLFCPMPDTSTEVFQHRSQLV